MMCPQISVTLNVPGPSYGPFDLSQEVGLAKLAQRLQT